VTNERIIAYVLIAIGALALVINIGAGLGWLWVTLMVLGVGFFAVDRLEPGNRWPGYTATVLIAAGVFIGLLQTGILGSIWFGVLLVVLGIFLLYRDQERSADGGWVEAPAPAQESATPRAPVIPVTRATPFDEPGPKDPLLHEPLRHEPLPPEPVASSTSVGTPRKGAGVDNSTSTSSHTPASTTPLASDVELNAETARVTLSPEAQERYGRLERWRKATAAKDGTPAYIVLRNETLEQLATRNPRTHDELKQIKGIGPVKLDRYGNELLAVLRGDIPPQPNA
jgi:predicted flap endonuclease-1-like 5' DNA nuclease